ncbi:MAG: DUF4258 domain-containing protein [Desulfobacteraceae bacterium]
MNIILSEHAKEQIEDRDIPVNMVWDVINNPAQKYNNDIDETVCQSRMNFDGKIYLLRVFVNFTKKPAIVISVYRTSKINKYWRV